MLTATVIAAAKQAKPVVKRKNYNVLAKCASVAQWSKRYAEDIDMGVQFSPGAIF